jgi:hypothetical protein
LSPKELFAYRASPASSEYDSIWHYWSAKEAAYKAYQQTAHSIFSPSAWEVDLIQGKVSFGREIFALRHCEDGDFLLAEVSDAPWNQVYHESSLFWTEPSPEDQSQEARRLACQLAAKIWGGSEEGYRVIKKGPIPVLQTKEGQSLAGALSLSHHGRWVTASLLKP